MRRQTAVGVGVVAVVLLAGCGGPAGDRPTTTPAASDPTDGTFDPPAAVADGVDGERLWRTHAAVVNFSETYRLRAWTVVESDLDGRTVRTATAAADADGLSTTLRVDDDRTERFVDRTRTLGRVVTDGQRRPFLLVESLDAGWRTEPAHRRDVRRVLTGAELERTDTTTVGGVDAGVFAGSLPASVAAELGSVEESGVTIDAVNRTSVTAVVDERGLVRRLEYEIEGADERQYRDRPTDVPVEANATVRFGPGGDVARPGWYGETFDDALGVRTVETDRGVAVELTNGRIPADGVVSLRAVGTEDGVQETVSTVDGNVSAGERLWAVGDGGGSVRLDPPSETETDRFAGATAVSVEVVVEERTVLAGELPIGPESGARNGTATATATTVAEGAAA